MDSGHSPVPVAAAQRARQVVSPLAARYLHVAGEDRMTQLTLKQLEIFHAIVVAGSISQANRSLGLSQPTVSQQLAKLEETLGVQLVLRGRAGAIRLTSAGTHWLKVARSVLGTLDEAMQTHNASFEPTRVALRFGTTPSLRGRFAEAAARMSLELNCFSRFDFVWALSSTELVEMINTRSLDIGVVSGASVLGQRSTLHVETLCQDRISWIVPCGIPDQVIAEAVATRTAPPQPYSALTRYVDVTSLVPWHDRTDNWYREMLPFATPFFGCMTHHVAVDFVAAGIATCHAPMSLVPNLPAQVRNRVKIFDLEEIMREVVLVMPKHLATLRPFKLFSERIGDFIRETYGSGDSGEDLRPIPGTRAAPLKAAE